MPAACLIVHILQWLLTTSSCGFNHRKQTSPMGLEVSNEQALADAKSCQLKPTPIFLKYKNQEITRDFIPAEPSTHLSQKLTELKISL